MRYAGRSLRALGVLFVAVSLSWTAVQAESAASASGTVRTYYIAADEIEWDYAPMNVDMMTGKPFDGYSKMFVEQGPTRIGQKFKKAVFREYTDDTFQALKPRPADLAHMGILGPVIRAEVGDTIKIVFRNNSSSAFSLHPHASPTRLTPRVPCTPMRWRIPQLMAWSRPAKRTPTPGPRANNVDPVRRTEVRWCGSTIPTTMSPRT